MHGLICGVTQSGKTTLAHKMAHSFAAEGAGVIVYDPVGTDTAAGNWPASAIVFSDEDEFFEYLSRDDVSGAYVFVDEAGDIFNSQKRENLWLLTRGRHPSMGAFSVFMICQRPKMILPTARNQAGVAYVFRLAVDDLKEIGKDFGYSSLEKETLDQGDFVVLVSGKSEYQKSNVFKIPD